MLYGIAVTAFSGIQQGSWLRSRGKCQRPVVNEVGKTAVTSGSSHRTAVVEKQLVDARPCANYSHDS
ncbi:hypothetical protein J6590_086248 [Homalodisca vitripennis]|nr:hypothetical protein J6590_086248 [Homalodisca vitripennis]